MEIYLAGHGRPGRAAGASFPSQLPLLVPGRFGVGVGNTVSPCLEGGNLEEPRPPATPASLYPTPAQGPHPSAPGRLEARPDRKRKLRVLQRRAKTKRLKGK